MAPAWSFPRPPCPLWVGDTGGGEDEDEDEEGGSCQRSPAHFRALHASLAVPTTDTCDLVCLNGGSCFLNARKQAKCRCQPRYNGDKCQIDQCWDYCQNGGTCAASPSGEPGGSRTDGQTDRWARS